MNSVLVLVSPVGFEPRDSAKALEEGLRRRDPDEAERIVQAQVSAFRAADR